MFINESWIGATNLMWLFCCGMRRSGSTLQFQLAADLVETAGLGQRVDWVPPRDFPILQKKYAGRDEWLVFKNHTFTPAMAAEFGHGKARGIYVYRDLRDVMVSLMRKSGITFETLWHRGFLAECLRNYQGWTDMPGVLVSRYEDMISDPAGEVGRIAAHLDIPCPPELQQKIAKSYSLDRQRRRIAAAVETGELRRGFGQDEFDPVSNLHTNHIHSGGSGAWQGVLDERQAALVEHLGRDWLTRHGYPLTTSATSRYWAAAHDGLKSLPQKLRQSLSPRGG